MPSGADSGTLLSIWSAAAAAEAAAAQALAGYVGSAAAADAALQAASTRFGAARARRAELRRTQGRAARALADTNGQIGRLHQEVLALSSRAAALDRGLARAVDGEARLHLRRSRAAVGLEMDDREQELARLRQVADQVRAERAQAAAEAQDTLLEEREAGRALDALRAALPPPRLYTARFTAALTVAHCDFLLEADAARWQGRVLAAADAIVQMHAALAGGRYRVDRHDELVGGRAPESGEAMYALLAAGDAAGAANLFGVACSPALYFHHMMAVFRCWTLGLYLSDAHAELADLVALHGDAGGARGAHAEAFAALLADDAEALSGALARLVVAESRAAARSRARGLALVNVAALAICRLAEARGLTVPPLGPTVPAALRALPPPEALR